MSNVDRLAELLTPRTNDARAKAMMYGNIEFLVDECAKLEHQLQTLLARITHCENCGASWYDDGNNGTGCPYCAAPPAQGPERAPDAVLVPREPPVAMVQALDNLRYTGTPSAKIYRAMIAATPTGEKGDM